MNMPSAVLKLAWLIIFVGSPPYSPAAVVEEVTGDSAGVQFMDYVEAGQIIKLGPQDKIVLGYLSSCWQEVITGGTVTVGTDWSEVKSGDVQRLRGQCSGAKMTLTGAQTPIAGRTFRGLGSEISDGDRRAQ